jgi:hypothetical protein
MNCRHLLQHLISAYLNLVVVFITIQTCPKKEQTAEILTIGDQTTIFSKAILFRTFQIPSKRRHGAACDTFFPFG